MPDRGAVRAIATGGILAAMTDILAPSPISEAAEIEAPAAAVLAVVDDYPGLRRALAARRAELGLSQLEADAIAGLSDGYTGKLEAGMRHFGDMSMSSLLGALGLKFIVVRDAAHKARRSTKRYKTYGPQDRAAMG